MNKIPFEQKEKSQFVVSRAERAVSAVMILFSLSFLFWRAQFGIECLDEMYFIIPAFNTIPHGDSLIVNEFQNANRHQDILNSIFLHPFAPFSVIVLRRMAVAFYACLLFLLSLVVFRRNWGFGAALSICACLLFDPFQMPAWSYNWWCRDFLILHAAMLWNAKEEKRGAVRSKVFVFLGGVAMGGAVIAYQPMLLPMAVSLTVLIGVFLFAREKKEAFHTVLFYAAGVGCSLGPDILYLILPSVRGHWLQAVKTMSQLRDFHSAQKIRATADYIFGNREVWAVVVGLPAFVWILKPSLKRWQRSLGAALYVLSLVYLAKRLLVTQYSFLLSQAVVALGVLSCVWIVSRSYKEKASLGACAALCSLAASFTMALVSVTGTTALFWAMPSLIIPGHASYRKWVSHYGPSLSKRIGALGPVFVLLLLIVLGSYRLQRYHTYFDVAPDDTKAELQISPLKGIRTSERRAFLIEKIHSVVEGKKFVLAFPDISLPFLWTRSALNSINANGSYPAWVQQQSLDFMLKNKRFPEVIIKIKKHYWDWGGSDEIPQLLHGAGDSVWQRFTECARKSVIISLDEFDAYEVDPLKVTSCAR